MLKRARGQYTDKNVERCSQVVGEFGKQFSRLVSEAVGAGVMSNYKKDTPRYKRDIEVFVEQFSPCAFFDVRPGRAHPTFKEFVAEQTLKDPEKFGAKLLEHSHTLDIWRRRAQARYEDFDP